MGFHRRRINLNMLLTTPDAGKLFEAECIIIEDSKTSELYEIWKKDKTEFKLELNKIKKPLN